MYFNSYIFILAFLPITVLVYYLINGTKRYKLGHLWLLLSSMVFIGYVNIYYVFVTLLASILGYLFIVAVTNKRYGTKTKKIFLGTGIVSHVAFLLYFKYMNFFLENVNTFLSTELRFLDILLPIGISFYTCQQIAYLVDCYRDPSVRCDFGEYLLFIVYFPKFLQGPIILHDDFFPALHNEENKQFDISSFSKGLYVFALGLGKKVLLADNMSQIVEAGFGNIEDLNSISVILAMIAYALQLYFDFSGYSDMAIGVGQMLQIPVPINFNSPYKATSVTDIWNRWHMTLTRFFTRYIYFPLGGSRKGNIRMYCNTFIVFVVSGLWHGAAWTYIVWGMMNGVVMSFNKVFQKCKIAVPKILGWLTTFVFWLVSLVVFRSESIGGGLEVFKQLLHGGMGPIYEGFYGQIEKMVEITLLQRLDVTEVLARFPEIIVIAFIFICLAGCIFAKNTQEKAEQFHYTYWKMFVTVGLLFYSILSLGSVSVFLYAVF